ncbi:retrovirus-related Pol polyprotein from transposon 412 [Trichonephila clavipes]|nr:retrovirus-related Pol polyprotein from transposon 412 [Trichonephila clavipes]
MLDEGIVQHSESPWSSPVVLRHEKDVYPLPRIDDTLDCLKGAKFFSSMDLRSGYWQIEIDEADREKTAFITPEGLYEFKVMPFGLYDIIVFSETFEDHLIRLRLVLKCLQEAGLKLNSKKCLLLPKKRFIKGFCYLAEPLQSLLKSGVEFHWGPEEVEAFNSLKKALTSDPVLGMYNERASTEIHTDASGGRGNGNTRQIFSSHDEYEPCDGTEKDQDLAKLKLLSNSSKNEEFRFIDGILCRKNFDPDGKLWLPVIPKHLRADILRHFHDAPTAGHLGFAKTYDRIRKRFYWPGMYRNVVRYVMHCRECQRRKSVPQRPPGRLVPIPPAIAPFHRIGIDLLGRFPKSAHGNKWIIVCTDYSTRYAITKALPTAEVDEIAKFLLEEIVLRHGAPRVIITDRGAVFRSRLVSSLVDLCNIDHRFTTAYHPQTNGLTERFNKTLADMLSMYVDVEQKNWNEILPFVTFAYNTVKQETTGFTPFYLLHGREAETTLDTMLPFCPNDFDDNNITKIAARAEESRQLARVHTLRAQDKDRRRYDSKHQMVSYAPGDLVWIYTPVRKVGLSEKLLRRYFGPYQVLRRLSAVTYAVQDFDPASRKRKLREVVHVLRMKPYHDPAEQIETEDIPPKESYKGPITRSRIKTLEQNDSGALSSFRGEQCRTHNLLQVPIAELAERWTEFPQVSDESRSFFRVHTGYFSNIPKCIKAEFIASWACSQSSVVSSSQR